VIFITSFYFQKEVIWLSVPIKTNVNNETYGDELRKIRELQEQYSAGAHVSFTTTGDISWTSSSSSITYDTSGSEDENIKNKGMRGLLYWLLSLFNLDVGSGGYGDCIIDANYLAEIVNAIVNSSLTYAEDGGANDSYSISLPNAPTSITSGFQAYFKVNTANTGACTLNINGLGAIAIKTREGNDLRTGMILADSVNAVVYDGTNFCLMNSIPDIVIANLTQYAADAGATDTYVITLSMPPAAYYTGMTILFKAATANTGAATINVNSLGAKALVDKDNNALVTGAISAGQYIFAVYDGTSFRILSSIISSIPTDGWTSAGETWEYASASTFTVSGDVTTKYQIGDKLKFTQTSVKYFYITDISYSNPDTTITVQGIYSDTVANDIITANYFSKSESPQGFYPEQIDGWRYAGTTWTQYSETKADGDINTGTDAVVTVVDVATGTPVGFTTATPTGITLDTIYYAIRVDSTHIKFATTLANAYAGTGVDITNVGSGSRVLNILDRIIITGDVRSKYQKGFKIKYTNSAVKYNYIIADPSLSGSNTILQISGFGYISTVNDSIPTLLGTAITNNFYSLCENPIGFPDWFSYIPKYSASGSMTYVSVTTNYAKFKISGKIIFVNVNAIGTLGGSANDTIYITLPIASLAGANILFGTAAVNTTPNLGQASIANNTASLMRFDLSNYSTGTGRYAVFSVFYEF
jgi:hypothetical protein